MPDLGYLYVLANSSMPGLVKVGKTTRTPSQRAQELAGVTGMPTPFIVVYEQLFEDCAAAEIFVHTMLERQGFRVSESREFFNAPVNNVVRAIVAAPGALEHADAKLIDCDPTSSELKRANPWDEVLEEAGRHYFGLGAYIQDDKVALRLYRQAMQLGSIFAIGRLGYMHAVGAGTSKDERAALEYFKEGADKESPYCCWKMGMLFAKAGHQANAQKSFARFFNLPHNGIAAGEWLEIYSDISGAFVEKAALMKIRELPEKYWPVDIQAQENVSKFIVSVFPKIIVERKAEIAKHVESTIDYALRRGGEAGNRMAQEFKEVLTYLDEYFDADAQAAFKAEWRAQRATKALPADSTKH
jgi:T5orf172 domain